MGGAVGGTIKMATQQTTGQQPQRALSGTTYATEEAMEGPWMDFEEVLVGALGRVRSSK